MSNDQPTKNFITPVILGIPSDEDQTSAALEFIQEQLGWEIEVGSVQLRLINKDQQTIAIETIRDLISEMAYAPHLGKPRAFVFLSADLLSMAAQHAFLKSLEEPPTNTLILLVTNAIDKLLPTIRSRCLSHISQPNLGILPTKDLPPILETLISDPNDVSYHELIDLGNEYKDRDKAIALIQQLLFQSHQQKSDPLILVKIQQQFLTTLKQLQANANVRLALESCFFNLKN